MSPISLSLIIPFLAGISTTIGYFPTYISEKYQEKVITFSLSFSAGVMITISIFSLLPESFHLISNDPRISSFLLVGLFFFIGILSSFIIDSILNKKKTNSKLYKLGIFSLITLILHNIPEGITTFLTTTSNLKLGITLSLAIALHNIPEGIAIAIPIFYATKNRKKAFLYTMISGFSEFLGAIFACLFLKEYLNFFLLSCLFGITAGIMIHISLTELLPNALEYKDLKLCIKSFLLGCLVMLICIFIFHI